MGYNESFKLYNFGCHPKLHPNSPRSNSLSKELRLLVSKSKRKRRKPPPRKLGSRRKNGSEKSNAKRKAKKNGSGLSKKRKSTILNSKPNSKINNNNMQIFWNKRSGKNLPLLIIRTTALKEQICLHFWNCSANTNIRFQSKHWKNVRNARSTLSNFNKKYCSIAATIIKRDRKSASKPSKLYTGRKSKNFNR